MRGQEQSSREALSAGATVPTRNPFVGRDRELGQLQQALEAACGGRGQLYLIVGEPGIGKTRLAEELGRHARTHLRVLVGRCVEGEGAPPFWPWIQIVRACISDGRGTSVAGGQDTPALAAELGIWTPDIAQIVPELYDHFPALPPAPVLDPAHARFRIFDGVTHFLTAVARATPILLVLDDLHWADRPSLMLLAFLTRALQDARILVLGTYRDIEVRPAHPLLPALAELMREPVCQRMTLRGLAQPDVARFIEIHAGRTQSDALATMVYEKSEGNPFFISELVRLLADEDDPLGAAGPARPFAIPHGVQAVIARRLNRLSEACNDLLTLAAALGREFDLVPLARVSDATMQQAAHTLDEAVRAGVVAEMPGTVDRYLFSHALVRESLYAELGAIRRIRLHRRIANVLGELYAADPAAHHDELAHHFFQAALGGEGMDEAVDHALRAAAYASTRFAYEQAADRYELALRALTLGPPDEGRRLRVLLDLGEAYARASIIERAQSVFLQAAALARQRGDAEAFTAAALGFGGIVVGVGTVNQTVVDLLQESLERLADGDSRLRVMVLARLSTELYFAPDAAGRTVLSQQAVDMARRLDDPTALIAALEAHHFCIWGMDDPAAQCALATEIVRLAETRNDRERLLIGHQFRVTDLLEMGEIVAVDTAIAAYARLADELRQPAFSWRLNVFQAMRALMTGRFDEAETLMATALSLGQRVQRQTAMNFYGVQLFSLRREQGRLAELEDSVRTFVDTYPAVPSWRSALASLYTELGREADARAEFEHLALDDFTLPPDNSRLMGLTLLAEVCAAIGDRARAKTLYDLLRPHADRNVVAGTAAACNGSVARPLGLLATTLARWDDADAHFEAALRAHRAMGARPFLARTQLEYAAMLCTRAAAEPAQAPRFIDRARMLLATAQRTASVLGMAAVQAKAEQWLAEITTPPSATGGLIVEEELPTAANLFRRDGELWTLSFGGEVCRLKDTRGLCYLAALLRQPHRELHALDLARPAGSSDTTASPSATPPSMRATDAGPALDAASRHAYRQRLQELRNEAQQAETTWQPKRLTAIKREIVFIERELARGTGLGGRARPIASDSERARVGVTRAIKLALATIEKRHPTLGVHLNASIRTGVYCRYSPPADQRIDWQVDGDQPAP